LLLKDIQQHNPGSSTQSMFALLCRTSEYICVHTTNACSPQ